jgi:hypothetical protein
VTADSVVDGEYSTQGWNRYAYCHNNPVMYRDPTGNAEKETWSAKLSPLGEIGAAIGSLVDAGKSFFKQSRDGISNQYDHSKKAVSDKLQQAKNSITERLGGKDTSSPVREQGRGYYCKQIEH